LTETAHVPGVEAVGIVNSIPFGPGQVGGGIVTDDAPDLKGHGAYYRLVNDGYFAALRIPVLRGRVFDRRDRLGSTPVAVVTQSFANAYWPGKNPIGHRIRWVPQFDAHDDWLEVVGVVGNTKEFAQDDASGPAVYVSYAQRPERALEGVTAVVRAHSVDAPMLTAIRDVVRDIDHDVPTTSISTLTRVISQSVANRRFTMSVMIGFGAFAMFLAALGLYSVLAYGVTRRSREIGVRIALGATPRGVLFAIVRDGMTAVSVGVIIGVASALALTRLMQSMLYGVAPTDAASFGLAIAALLAVGAAACALPARRAALIDPADAMRSD
jgi:putative ABC transport system permease protein